MRLTTFVLLLTTTIALAANAGTAQLRSEFPDEPVLRPGDVLRITIWREEDLSGDFIIDGSGNVTLPMLGELSATSRSTGELVEFIAEEYRKQIRNPSIEVVPLRQIFLLGDVAEPGLYSVPPTTTLATAVALAGGPSATGDISKLRVVRDGRTVLPRVSMDEAINVVDIRSGDQIYVGRTGWVQRNAPYIFGVGITLLGFLLQSII